MILFFTETIKFGLSIFILYFIPGYILIDYLKKDCKICEKSVLSFSTGVIIIPQIYIYFESLKLHNLFLIFVTAGSFMYCIYKLKSLFFSTTRIKNPELLLGDINQEKILLCGIILAIVIITSLAISTSGVMYEDGMRFYQSNAFDSMTQLSIVGEVAKEPPHMFPCYSGVAFKGYHIGAFYWRAIIQKVTGINPVDLFFKLCPLFLFPLIVLMTFFSIRNFSGNNGIALLTTFFIFLMNDLSWFFPILDRLFPSKGINTVDFGGGFLHGFMFNPPVAHGILILFLGLYFLKEMYRISEKQRLWLLMILTGFLFGSLYEYKSFMWAVALPALLVTGAKEYFLKKKTFYLTVSVIAIIFSALSFYNTSSNQHMLSLFKIDIGYYPLSVLREMKIINPGVRIGFFMMLFAFLFYLIGVLGIKIIGFCKLYEHLKKWNKIPEVIFFLIIAAVLSFLFTHTLLFKSNYFYATYNFSTIFFMVISIFTAEMIITWTKNLSIFFRTVLFSAIAIIGIGSTIFLFLRFFPQYSEYIVVSKKFVEATDFLKKNSKEDAIILHNPVTKYWICQKDHKIARDEEKSRDSFLSALAQRRVVFECSWSMRMGLYANDIDKREKDIESFFDTNDKNLAIAILDDYKTNYVWLEQGQRLNFESSGILKKVFANSKVQIYERM